MRLSATVTVSLILALCGIVAAPASGSVLEVQFSGMDLVYNGTDLFDTGASNVVGTGTFAQADPLLTMSFLVDGVQQGTTLNTNIAIDTFIKGLSGIPAAGGSVVTSGNGNAFGLDLLTKTTTPGWGLALNIDKFSFFYSGNKVAIATSGQSTALWSQALPFGLAFDPSQPISIVLSSANLTNVTTANGLVTGFRAAGTGNISGTLLPEPTTMLLLALSGMALVRRRTR
jgi:hypothetical protein